MVARTLGAVLVGLLVFVAALMVVPFDPKD